MMTQTFRRPSLTQLCDTHDPPSPLSGWVPATTTALLLPFPTSSSPPQGPRCSFGLLAWPAPTLPIWEAFLASLENRSLPHPTTLFVSFWPLAMAEIPRAWILGRCHGTPEMGQMARATIHLPRPARTLTVPQRRSPASSPHPPPPLPRLPRSGDVS